MKYCVPFFIIFSTLLQAVAPTQLEMTIIEVLANSEIVVDQSQNPKLYRLGDTITRVETVGVALKAANIYLPENYFCRNYFRDVSYNPTNNWICRAIEIATDNGIISRLNEYARPNDPITRVEALAIIMQAGKVFYERGVDRTNYPRNMPQWQVDLLEGALQYHIISSIDTFGPNARATRMDVFGMAYNMFFAGKKLSSFQFSTKQYYDFSSAPQENPSTGDVDEPDNLTLLAETRETNDSTKEAQLQKACTPIFLYMDCLMKRDDPEYKPATNEEIISRYTQQFMENGSLDDAVQRCDRLTDELNNTLNKHLRAGCWLPGSSIALQDYQEAEEELEDFSVSAPEKVVTGEPFDVTIKALNGNGDVMKNYTGMALFSITDGDSLEHSYEKELIFRAENQGTIIIRGIVLSTPKEYIAGVSQDLVVYPPTEIEVLDELGNSMKSLVSFSIVVPDKIKVNTPFSLTISALDEDGKAITGYKGQVFIEPLFTGISLQDIIFPSEFDYNGDGYRFTSSDLGKHTFKDGFIIKKAGEYSFLIFDSEDDEVDKEFSIIVE